MTDFLPAHLHEPYTGTARTAQAMLEAANGPRGAQSLKLRLHTEDLIRHVSPRNYLSQMAAIYNWFVSVHRYLKDPVPSELVKDPVYTLTEIEKKGLFLGDCDDAATYLVGAARSIGIPAVPVRVGFRKVLQSGKLSVPFTHVLAVARDQLGRTVALDPVAGAKTYKMLRKTKSFG